MQANEIIRPKKTPSYVATKITLLTENIPHPQPTQTPYSVGINISAQKIRSSRYKQVIFLTD
jgi:hypothetical protein